ncbi:MAG: hypothetical protein ACTSUE_10255 [Promethearchaeota archaeon]
MSYKPDASHLVEIGDGLMSTEQYIGALKNYSKAANIFIENGSYFRVYETYNKIVEILKIQGKIGEAITRVLAVAQKLKDFKIYEESARFYEYVGNLCSEVEDYNNSMVNFEIAAQLYLKIFEEEKNDEFRKLSGILLIKSSESAYRIKTKKEKSETLMLEGIFRYSGLKSKITPLEDELINNLKVNKFSAAKSVALNLTGIIHEILSKVKVAEVAESFEGLDVLFKMVHSRVMHLAAEYNFLAYLLSRQLDGGSELKNLTNTTEDTFIQVLNTVREILPKEYDAEDLDRYCFDGFMLTLFNALEDNNKNGTLVSNFLNGFSKDLASKVQSNQYYNLMEKITKFGLELSKEMLWDAPLGNFSKFKSIFLKLVLS